MLRKNLSLPFLAFCFALIAGCGGGGNTSSGGTTLPGLSVSTLATFTAVSGSSSFQTLTLTNIGTATLTLSSMVIGGTNATYFTQTNTCGALPASLAPNSACSVTITFAPTAVGVNFSATVTLTDNAAGSPQTVTLSGTGTAPLASAVTFSPGSLIFPPTNVGTASASQSIAVTNTGTAPLIITSIGVTDASYSDTNTCTAPLPAGTGNCTIYVTFMPTTTGTIPGSVSVTDNAASSQQSIGFSGTGTAPAVTLTSNLLTFTSTPTVTTPAQSITLTNTGTATLNIDNIKLGGTDMSDFALATSATPCGTTLTAGSNCIISATFTPTASANNNYTATITITDNAMGTPQVITLNGTTSAVTRTLYTFPETDNSVTPLYALVNNAKTSIDMTMYELQDSVFTADLVAACTRGVKVRVVLSSSETSSNAIAYSGINGGGANCSAVYSNTKFTNTHQKTITVDNATTAIMSLNLQSQYYSTTRDFAVVENDAADIADIETTFNQDYAAGGTSSATEFAYQPGPGDNDLIWSPTTAKADMISIITNAKSTLLIENEELASSAGYITSALATACQNHVTVHIAMVYQSDWKAAFDTLKAAGCSIHTYPDTTTGFYIHAKAVVADYGLSTQSVYMGSINYSNASMTANRELGMYLTDRSIVTQINNTMANDYTGGTAY